MTISFRQKWMKELSRFYWFSFNIMLLRPLKGGIVSHHVPIDESSTLYVDEMEMGRSNIPFGWGKGAYLRIQKVCRKEIRKMTGGMRMESSIIGPSGIRSRTYTRRRERLGLWNLLCFKGNYIQLR